MPKRTMICSNFVTMHAHGAYVIDKSLFIKELMDLSEKYKAIRIARPSRFGKSTLLTMLRGFLQTDPPQTHTAIFKTLEIWENFPDWAEKHHGNYQVLQLDFSRVSSFNDISEFNAKFHHLLQSMYRSHNYTLKEITQPVTSEILIEGMINFIQYLKDNFKKNIILLFDSYYHSFADFIPEPLYSKVSEFYDQFITQICLDNSNVTLSLIFGTLLTPHDKIFSSRSDTLCSGMLAFNKESKKLAQLIGMNPDDVQTMLSHFEAKEHTGAVEKWYGGYHIADTSLLPPIALLRFIGQNKKYGLTRTRDFPTDFLSATFPKASKEVKSTFFKLLTGNRVIQTVNAYIDGNTLQKPDIAGSVFFGMSLILGYLTIDSSQAIEQKNTDGNEIIYECTLRIPNTEVQKFLKKYLRSFSKIHYTDETKILKNLKYDVLKIRDPAIVAKFLIRIDDLFYSLILNETLDNTKLNALKTKIIQLKAKQDNEYLVKHIKNKPILENLSDETIETYVKHLLSS